MRPKRKNELQHTIITATPSISDIWIAKGPCALHNDILLKARVSEFLKLWMHKLYRVTHSTGHTGQILLTSIHLCHRLTSEMNEANSVVNLAENQVKNCGRYCVLLVASEAHYPGERELTDRCQGAAGRESCCSKTIPCGPFLCRRYLWTFRL